MLGSLKLTIYNCYIQSCTVSLLERLGAASNQTSLNYFLLINCMPDISNEVNPNPILRGAAPSSASSCEVQNCKKKMETGGLTSLICSGSEVRVKSKICWNVKEIEQILFCRSYTVQCYKVSTGYTSIFTMTVNSNIDQRESRWSLGINIFCQSRLLTFLVYMSLGLDIPEIFPSCWV